MLFLVVNHGFWQHRFYHLIHEVGRLVRSVTWPVYSVVINQVRFGVLTTVIWRWLSVSPVEANIASPLMTEFKGAFGFLLRNSSENQKSPFGFLQVLWILSHESVSDIDFLCVVNSFLLILIEHNVANIFNVLKIYFLEVLYQIMNYLLLYPNENEAVLHHWSRDL